MELFISLLCDKNGFYMKFNLCFEFYDVVEFSC